MMNIQQIRMDLRRNCSFNILLLVLYSHFLGFGQQVKLFVSDPVNAQLCQTAEAGSTLINTGTIDITNATLWLELPIGIEYVPGSV
ncbi:MAG: hypothetical protein WBO44_07265, partial [Saprospiraceae bacterium]